MENAICFKKKIKISTTPSKADHHNVLTDLAKAWKELREKKMCRSAETENKPFYHFNIEAEALVDGVGPPPDARLELEHFRWTQNQAVLHKKYKESLIQHNKVLGEIYNFDLCTRY